MDHVCLQQITPKTCDLCVTLRIRQPCVLSGGRVQCAVHWPYRLGVLLNPDVLLIWTILISCRIECISELRVLICDFYEFWTFVN